MKFVSFLLAALTGALFLAACGAREQSPAEVVNIMVGMSEFTFSPAELTLKVGQQVTLELVNNGQIEHELMVGRQVKMRDGHPDGFSEELFGHTQPTVEGGLQSAHGEMGGHDTDHGGFMVILPEPGEKATITFTVTQDMVGEWEIGCFSQDGVHYAAGMQGKLVVIE